MVSQFRVGFQILQSALNDFALTSVAQLCWRFFERKPECPLNFDSHLGRNVSQAPRAV
jgi:hypothetical protein